MRVREDLLPQFPTTIAAAVVTEQVPGGSRKDSLCSICQAELSEEGMGYDGAAASASSASSPSMIVLARLDRCQHTFHRDCLYALVQNSGGKDSLDCPTCKASYGVKTGSQPVSGRMTHVTSPRSLPGFENCGTITITYDFPGGIQGAEHPNPGTPYRCTGFPRVAYLPDNGKGRLVLRRLKTAFERRLVFTVGRSVTTGADNVVTWNDIHHKTSATGGPNHFGYPDPRYLDSILEELKAAGVTN